MGEVRVIRLCDLKILALDCQATGATPDKGHLLEIGWMAARAGSASLPPIATVASCLIQSPAQPQTPIPPVVARLTGISDSAMAQAVAPITAWRRLLQVAHSIAAENRSALCPAVIHFARFETPFLRRLHETVAPDTPFPLEIICTHAIAARLLPELPRRGIRALAGYLGHRLPEFKRSADHVLATVSIWKAMVELLAARCQVCDWDQLADWLARTPVPRRTQRLFPMNPVIRQSLPDKPGVYRMRGAGSDILYIGKAKSLKRRVNSYFRSRAAHPEHILEMLSQARQLDFSLTASALEAAVLETDEIKRHRPPYNIALRPGRRHLVFCTRDLKQHAAECDSHFCIGPLPGGSLIAALEAFETWLANGMSLTGDAPATIALTALGFASAHRPEIQCLKDGFELFCSDHRHRLQNRSALRVVTSLGAELWRNRLKTITDTQCRADTESEDNDVDTPQNVAPSGEPAWTPADVAGALQGMLMHGARLLRRARWFCLLSESCLAWASAAEPDELKCLLVFEKGAIAHRGVLEAGGKLPEPSGRRRSWQGRRKNLDLVTYDRMRVVTTELRRLVCEGRRIELRLGSKACLTSAELKRALPWV